MLRDDFQRLARLRLREARELLRRGLPAGAYYLAGYAVECGLKACIARHTRRYEFPDRQRWNQSYIHDLTRLVEIAGLGGALIAETGASRAFSINWGVVKDWSEESRYDHTITMAKARDFYRALTKQQTGVMRWVRRHW